MILDGGANEMNKVKSLSKWVFLSILVLRWFQWVDSSDPTLSPDLGWIPGWFILASLGLSLTAHSISSLVIWQRQKKSDAVIQRLLDDSGCPPLSRKDVDNILHQQDL